MGALIWWSAYTIMALIIAVLYLDLKIELRKFKQLFEKHREIFNDNVEEYNEKMKIIDKKLKLK